MRRITNQKKDNLLQNIKDSNKGITLIALAATIIVMLILAGITINMAFVENGIIKKSQYAQNMIGQDQNNDVETIQGLRDELNYMLNSSKIKLSLDKTQAELTIGETITLTATVTAKDIENKEVKWTSSDENIVTVENGVVTAVGIGEATITVTTAVLSDRKAECKISVKSDL